MFRYITFRTGGAILTGLLFVFLFGPAIIDLLRVKQGKGQPIREDGPQSHFAKRGTPTMGGLMILGGVTVATLLWANLANPYVWIVLLVTLGFGAIGFYDDYLKVTKRGTAGFSSQLRLAAEIAIAGIATIAVMRLGTPGFSSSLTVPFFKNCRHPARPLLRLRRHLRHRRRRQRRQPHRRPRRPRHRAGDHRRRHLRRLRLPHRPRRVRRYLQIHYVPGVGELAIICGALIGAGLGFLWFNAPPAMIFMGDTGSLALGGALGAIAVATKHEIVLAIVGGLFVLETLSVIIQVLSFKLTGKRVFRMAPLHHHFEEKGWRESTVVVRFWIISVVLALVSLATLKLR